MSAVDRLLSNYSAKCACLGRPTAGEGDDSDGSGAHTSSSFVDQNRIASRRTRMVTLIRYSRELAGAIGPCQLALT
jgi:hypothetical protein